MNVIGKTPDGKFIIVVTANEMLSINDGTFNTQKAYESIGEDIHNYRRKLGVNQSTMANHLGMSRNYLSQIENGCARNISAKFRDAIVAVLSGASEL